VVSDVLRNIGHPLVGAIRASAIPSLREAGPESEATTCEWDGQSAFRTRRWLSLALTARDRLSVARGQSGGPTISGNNDSAIFWVFAQ
ncbi:MAG: hypothetical protein AAFQ99_11500, partial [Pseudomonadota bacterium]